MEQFEQYGQLALDYIIKEGPNVLIALIILFIGLKVINFLASMASKAMLKAKMEESLAHFIKSLVNWGLKILLFISVAQKLGVETTSFVAVIGAAGLAVGLALQGTLANFAGGVLILIFKPFKVGDLIESQGIFGEVEEIQIFITKVITPQNQVVVLPNAKVSNENLKNFSEKGLLRVDLTVGISYGSNIKQAKDVLMNVMTNNEKVLKDPAPLVAVSNLGDSSVDLAVRPWATPETYWDVYFEIYEQSKIALDEAGISIPFPQRDVHMIPQS